MRKRKNPPTNQRVQEMLPTERIIATRQTNISALKDISHTDWPASEYLKTALVSSTGKQPKPPTSMHKTKVIVKRSRKERRVKDAGPPSGGERRIAPERRFPLVVFTEFDEHIEFGEHDGEKAQVEKS
jgi:hypothetical protein